MIERIKKGFTLVELSLAIVFITILILSIGYLTIHITSTYEKGLAMKAVNSVGKELIDDFSRAIAASPARTIESLCGETYPSDKKKTAYNDCVADKGHKIFYQQHYNKVKIKGEEQVVPTNGVFCTGRYSYLWNTAYSLNPDDYPKVIVEAQTIGTYKSSKVEYTEEKPFRLLKVTDFTRGLCKMHLDENHYLYKNEVDYDISGEGTMAPEVEEELLENSENNLALYDLTMFSPTVHKLTSSGFYSGTFILATLRGGINIFTEGEFCSDPPDNLNTDFAYCAINKFNFAMRADGEKLRGE